jgi:hypothetical protein
LLFSLTIGICGLNSRRFENVFFSSAVNLSPFSLLSCLAHLYPLTNRLPRYMRKIRASENLCYRTKHIEMTFYEDIETIAEDDMKIVSPEGSII